MMGRPRGLRSIRRCRGQIRHGINHLCDPPPARIGARKPRRLPGGARAAVPAAGVLHRRRDGRAHSAGVGDAVPRAQRLEGGFLSRGGGRGIVARGVLVHDRAALRGDLPQGRRARSRDHVPLLRPGGQHPGARLYRRRSRRGPRGGAVPPVARVRHRHRTDHGAAVPGRRRGARPAGERAVRKPRCEGNEPRGPRPSCFSGSRSCSPERSSSRSSPTPPSRSRCRPATFSPGRRSWTVSFPTTRAAAKRA